ncbi:zinc finger CCCH domain-containing protein 40-like [Silene latifolia]|uniref:zinc finger CCCH domain-containing protein 40-like n=1 Tax=Silene latifolia TaxID=37657 RepID=UPI003D76A68A
MAHRFLRDNEADGWERSDFPIVCDTCLGDNPYVRMETAHYNQECKICTRPFTVFRWRPGRNARYKKTEICQTCCKLKNVCQVCLLDLDYGLPVQVRDTALSISTHDAIPKSDVNREYFAEEHARKARAGLDYESSYGKMRPNDTILKLQRTTPHYERNAPRVCSFHIKGECTRAVCPYRHKMPVTGDLSKQNIKDRYHGVNDPVANKLLNKAREMQTLEPPEDKSIKTLYVGGLDDRITEQDLRDIFYAHGEIESIRMVLQGAYAFVSYTTREAAERAADELSNKLIINGLRLKLNWGRTQQPKPESTPSQGQHPPPMPYFNILPPPQQHQAYYPSMDPQRMGAVIPSQDGASSSGSGPEKYDQGQHSYTYQGLPPQPGQYQQSYYQPYGCYMPPPPPNYQHSRPGQCYQQPSA